MAEAIVVELGPARYGLAVRAVREVLRPPPIAAVPFPPPAVCGVAAVRGAVIPVLDLGLLLQQESATRPGTLVVTRAELAGEPLGLLVDRVREVVDLGRAESLLPPQEAEVSLPAGWVSGVIALADEQLVTLLDLESVLAMEKEPGGKSR